MKTISQLKTELTSQRALLDRIAERVHRSRMATDAAERGLDKALAELKRDQVEAVLQERESPNPELRKKLATLNTLLHNATAELEGALEAQRIQLAKVQALEAETQARELEADRLLFEPAVTELFRAFDVMKAAAASVSKTLSESGRVVDLAEIMFPLKPCAGGWPDYQKIAYVNALQSMYNGASAANKLAVAYSRKDEIAAA